MSKLAQRMRNDLDEIKRRDDWGKHRWGMVITYGMGVSFLLEYLIDAIVQRMLFTPHYSLHHNFTEFFEHIVLGNDAALQPLFHQLAVWNAAVEHSIVLVVGFAVGCLVPKKHALAGVLAVLPFWIFTRASSIFATVFFSPMYDLAGGERGLAVGTSDFVLNVLTKITVLVTAVVGALIGRYVSQIMRRRNDTSLTA